MDKLTGLKKYEQYFPFLLLAVSLLVYANTITHGFVLDDEAVIVKNRFVQQGFAGIGDILSTFYWKGYWDLNSGLYRPLSLIMLAIEWQLSPDNPFIHHFVQVLLYAGCIWLLYRFLCRLLSGYSPAIAFIITLLFAVHPLHTEVVANIKSRDELLCFFFFLLLAHEVVINGKAGIKAALFFLLALLSKEAAVAFIPVLALLLAQFHHTGWKDILKKLWPLGAVLAGWLLWRSYVLYHAPPRVLYTYADNSLLACNDQITRLMTALSILGRYLTKIVYPIPLSYDYSYGQVPCATIGSGYLWLGILLTAGLLWIAVKTFRSRPAVSFGIFFFFITSALTINIFFIIGTTMAERLMFTPLLGLLVAMVTGIAGLGKPTERPTIPQAAGIIFIALAFFFSLLTVQRNKAWASNYTLFETDVQNAPGSARTHYNYGTALLNTAPGLGSNTQYSEALAELEQAYAIDPNDLNTRINLGVALYKNGLYDRAVTILRSAAQQYPADHTIRLNLADAYVKLNAWDSAVHYYQAALDKGVYMPNTHNYYGLALFNMKNYAKAEEVYAAGLKIHPDNAELWLNYGNSLGVQNRFDKAIPAFARAYELDKTKKQALYFIALSYSNMGNKEKAEEYMRLYNNGK